MKTTWVPNLHRDNVFWWINQYVNLVFHKEKLTVLCPLDPHPPGCPML